MHDIIDWPEGQGPTQYQCRIAGEYDSGQSRVAIRGPHGLGKTCYAAQMTHHFAQTHEGDDWKVATTASVGNQLKQYLWPEIHKWAYRINWAKTGRAPYIDDKELLMMELKLRGGRAYAINPAKPVLIEGAHADNVFYCFDESKAINDKIFEGAEGAFSGAGSDTTMIAIALMMSTPGAPIGHFYDVCTGKIKGWKAIHITKEEVIAAGRMSQEWAEYMAETYGINSPIYQKRVLGNFAASEEGAVIPLSWIEEAHRRWYEWEAQGKPGRVKQIGADIAEEGEDDTIFAKRYDNNAMDELVTLPKQKIMRTAAMLGALLKRHGCEGIIDANGLGSGVYGRLAEQDYQVHAFIAQEGTDLTDLSGEWGFVDTRSAAWWNMREMLNPENNFNVKLPPNERLTGELSAPTWEPKSGGRIKVESKKDIKKRIGRSTDAADAVTMAFFKKGTFEMFIL